MTYPFFLIKETLILWENTFLRFLCQDTQNDAKVQKSDLEKNSVMGAYPPEKQKKKDVNWDSHIASSLISQSFFFEDRSILLDFSSLTEEASWMYQIFKIWCCTIKKIKKFKFVLNLKFLSDSYKI